MTRDIGQEKKSDRIRQHGCFQNNIMETKIKRDNFIRID
jgi:hypothetical protein